MLGIAAYVGERQHHQGKTRRRRPRWHCGVVRSRTKAVADNGISPYRAGYVLELLFAQIGKLDRDLSANLIVSRRRYADAAGFGDTLKPGCNVDAVSKNILALDEDVAEVDPHPKQHAPIPGDAVIALGHSGLHRDGALHRVDYRRKLDQQTIARGLYDTTAMLRHQRIGNGPVFTQGAGGADLVEAHQSRITGHIGGHDSRQSPSDPVRLVLLHGKASPFAHCIV